MSQRLVSVYAPQLAFDPADAIDVYVIKLVAGTRLCKLW